MSRPGMTVQDTQPASLLPLLSLSDYSEAAAPAGAFAQLLNMFLAPPLAAPIAPLAPEDSAASAEFSNLPATAPEPANDPAHLVGAEVIRLDEKNLIICDLPELPTSELSGFTSAESAAITPPLAGPVIETNQNTALVARSQAAGDTQSADAVDAAPVTMARGPRRDEEPPANDLAETRLAGTPPMTSTQLPIGIALPAMFEASGQNELSNDMRQSASPLSKSTGLDGSAVPRSPTVEMPTALARETATAVERPRLELLNQATDDLTTKQQVALPIATTKAPARSDDRDRLKAQSSRNENQASMTLSDSFLANATTALKQSDGMRGLPFTERLLEIDPEPNPSTSGAADVIAVKQTVEKCQGGMAAASPGDEHSAAKDGWQGQPRDGDAPANPSMVAGVAPARIHQSDRGETSAPAWSRMVERLARDIGEHFRVGEQQAVLQLEPPELGKVKIELRIGDGQLHVRIAAEGQESQALIERHLPELHQALRAGQIDAGAVRVTQGEWNGGGDLAQSFSQSPQGRQESPRGFASTAAGDEAMTEHLAQPSPPSADGRISMWA